MKRIRDSPPHVCFLNDCEKTTLLNHAIHYGSFCTCAVVGLLSMAQNQAHPARMVGSDGKIPPWMDFLVFRHFIRFFFENKTIKSKRRAYHLSGVFFILKRGCFMSHASCPMRVATVVHTQLASCVSSSLIDRNYEKAQSSFPLSLSLFSAREPLCPWPSSPARWRAIRCRCG